MTSRPDAIVTKHLVRNILLTMLVVAVAAGAFLWWRSMSARRPAVDTAPVETPVEQQEIQEAESPYVLSVEDATSTISDYYALLAQGDFVGLRQHGFEEVASAVELGWVRETGLEIHAEYIKPDAKDMPQPVGTYAGNDLYEIGSFFTTTPPQQCVKSIVTGETGPIGWVYHDALDGKWHIVDPAIPLATQAPAAGSQSRQSEDKQVLAEMSSSGVFRNQWWAITMFTVQVTSASKTDNVKIEPREFDDGITNEVPETLTKGIASSDVPIVPQVAADGTTSPLVAKASGVCIVWRGNRKDFDPSLIGQRLQQIDGVDMAPVRIVVRAEDITPVFPIDNKTAESTSALLNEEQVKRYGVDGVIASISVADQQAYEQQALGLGGQQGQGGTDGTQPQDQAVDLTQDITQLTQPMDTGEMG